MARANLGASVPPQLALPADFIIHDIGDNIDLLLYDDEEGYGVTAEQRAVILKPEDVAAAVLFVAGLPPHVSVPELVIKPTVQAFV